MYVFEVESERVKTAEALCLLHLAFAEGRPSLTIQRFFYFFEGRDHDWLDLFT